MFRDTRLMFDEVPTPVVWTKPLADATSLVHDNFDHFGSSGPPLLRLMYANLLLASENDRFQSAINDAATHENFPAQQALAEQATRLQNMSDMAEDALRILDVLSRQMGDWPRAH